MAGHDYDIGTKLGAHEQAIHALKEAHQTHHKRIEKVEQWQSLEEKSKDKKKAQFAIIKISIGLGILLLACMSYIALSIASPSDLKAMQPQLIELIKWLASFLH